MARKYKVRLDDGSQIDLDLQAVKDWRTQGLLKRDSPVLKPGSKQWQPLHQALELQDLRSPSQKRAASSKKVEPAAAPAMPRAIARQTWRTIVAGVLLVAAAVGAGFFWLRPERWLPALDRAPWREIALGLLISGLLLVRGWEWGRRIVRLLAFVAAFAVFPLAGLLIVDGVRGRALFVLAAAWVMLSGLIALLSGAWLSRMQAAASLLLVLAGIAGVGQLGLVEESEEQKRVREFLAGDGSFNDAELGLTLEAREPWRLLRADQGAVTVPPEARVVLARPRRGGFAYLLAVKAPRGIVTVDDYLNRVLLERAQTQPAVGGGGRHEVTVGGIQGRGATSFLDAGGVRVRDLTAAWRSGWTYFALVAWLPDDGSPGPRRDLEALQAGFSFTQTMARLLEQSVDAVTRDVPLLSRATAEALLRESSAQMMAPEQAFRRGFQLAGAGLPGLPAAEAQEIGALTAAAYAGLSAKDRTRLAAYLERVRADQPTLPQEDREMAALTKRALLQLNAARLGRIQELYGKAIAAGIARG
ncbi:MAG TPA: hypothetical protein VFM88_00805 [Vicinamibacteria bacterium]|nr:hypothetical protein [Vicinamibacteria bacterium]